MIIIIPSFSKTGMLVRGSLRKGVNCEACGCVYEYEMIRDAVGQDNSMFS